MSTEKGSPEERAYAHNVKLITDAVLGAGADGGEIPPLPFLSPSVFREQDERDAQAKADAEAYAKTRAETAALQAKIAESEQAIKVYEAKKKAEKLAEYRDRAHAAYEKAEADERALRDKMQQLALERSNRGKKPWNAKKLRARAMAALKPKGKT